MSTPGVSDGPTPAPQPPSDEPRSVRPRRGLIALAVMAVVAVVAGVVGVLVVGDDDGPDVEGAAAGLERMIDDPRFFSNGVLEECPLGDVGGVEAAVRDHGDVTGLSEREYLSLDPYERMEASVVCSSRSVDEASLLEVVASRVPEGDDHAWRLGFLHITSEIDVEDPRDLQGGELWAYCTEDVVDPDGCGAEWVHGDDLIVGIYGRGLALDADGAAAVLEEVLPDLLAALAVAEPVYVE